MKIWGTCSLPSPSVVCWSRAEVLNLLRVRDSFEKPMQAIDSLPRKMHLAKYMSTILQRFQEFLDLPKAHP